MSRPSGRSLGAGLALAGALVLFYEFVAIFDGHGDVPTISRIWQGIRDWSPFLGFVMGALTILLASALVVFTAWLVRHFWRDRRSTL